MTNQPTLTPKGRRGQTWSQDESAKAADIWQRHFTDHYGEDYERPKLTSFRYQVVNRIAGALKRSYDSVDYRLRIYGPSFGANQRSAKHASVQQIEDMASRREAELHHSLTGSVFGDPPPGFSALDRKRQGLRT
jgi:hypothetical protein